MPRCCETLKLKAPQAGHGEPANEPDRALHVMQVFQKPCGGHGPSPKRTSALERAAPEPEQPPRPSHGVRHALETQRWQQDDVVTC